MPTPPKTDHTPAQRGLERHVNPSDPTGQLLMFRPGLWKPKPRKPAKPRRSRRKNKLDPDL